MSGTKVETYEVLCEDIKGVVVGKILTIEEHPDADKLVVTTVDVGTEIIQIVTGADNISVGDYIPIALVGAELAEGLRIKKGNLRGVESNGMMCSVEELGLSVKDFAEAPEHGIYLFGEAKELGIDVKPFFGLDDQVVEYEITSNRSDSYSVIGVAREAAATFKKELKLPEVSYTSYPGDISDYMKVSIEDSSLCSRFMGKIITDVNIEESPKWLKDKLRACGIGPINNLVDITNFIMLEYGQPMHAYDLDLLDFPEIIVRAAKEGEVIQTLDGDERELDETMIVIADREKPIGVAGVMGGENTKVLDTTKTIFFEAANFNGTSIRKTSKKLGLRTDASSKFEKHLDPNLAALALERACQLIDMLGAGKVMEGSIDEYPVVRNPKTIEYNVDSINKLVGTSISEDEMIDIFKLLEFEVDRNTKTLVIPTFRADVNVNADLAEEVARLYGYDNIPVTLATGTPTVGKKNQKQKIEDIAKRMMEANGVSESMSYSFESPKAYEALGIGEDHPLHKYATISNPLGEDFSVMRTTTVNGMLNVLATNYNRRNEDVRLYEIGKTYLPKELPLKDYPIEGNYLTIGMYGNVDFFDVKGVVETLFTRLGMTEDVTYDSQIDLPFLHPGRKASISFKGREVGYMGEVHPDALDNYDIGTRTYLAVIDMNVITEVAVLTRSFKPVPKYPAVNRDIALLVKQDILVGQIEFLIKQRGGKLLESYKLFDVYQGEQIEEGYKSVAYSLTFRAEDHTLLEAEVSTSVTKILKGLEFELGVTIRS
jgi:phenylalanyl-tRNA synthetase beta chain